MQKIHPVVLLEREIPCEPACGPEARPDPGAIALVFDVRESVLGASRTVFRTAWSVLDHMWWS
jgi:hypothetical protein